MGTGTGEVLLKSQNKGLRVGIDLSLEMLKIVEKTVEALSKFEPLDSFLAFVGPSAKACCYEVGEDFKNYFSCLHFKNKSFYMDTQEEAIWGLKKERNKAPFYIQSLHHMSS